MDQRGAQIKERLESAAHLIGVGVGDMISIKITPLQPIQPQDGHAAHLYQFDGQYFDNAYQYHSEYEAGKKLLNLNLPVKGQVLKISSLVRHPHPWDDFECLRIIKENNKNDVFWIQHETGLEIVGFVKDIVEIAKNLIDVFKGIKEQIKKNKTDNNSDRYYKQVTKTIITTRRYDPHTRALIEEVIEENEITSETNGLTEKSLVKAINK